MFNKLKFKSKQQQQQKSPARKDGVSIYEELLKLGYTDEAIREAGAVRPPTRGFTLGVSDTPDGVPIVGVTYASDFRSEEETGPAELRKAFGVSGHSYAMSREGRGHFGVFTGLPEGAGSLILSVRPIAFEQQWGHDIATKTGPVDAQESWLNAVAHGSLDQDVKNGGYYRDLYDSHYTNTLGYVQELPDLSRYGTMERIRAAAEKIGIPGPFPRKKADLIEYVMHHPVRLAKAVNSSAWPGWFHHGDVLVLRADRGIVADTLRLLVRAAQNETLAFGGGSQLFGSGMSFYDGMDVGPKLEQERRDAAAWYDLEMKKLEPVKEELKKRGFSWYYLGGPKKRDNGDTIYWLNGSGQPQPFGWYTREQLLAEAFVADAEEKRKAK